MTEPGRAQVSEDERRNADLQAQIEAFRVAIGHERQALPTVSEEAADQKRDQAASLGETFVAASTLTLRGFERAEFRLAALEQDLQGRMTQLSRDLQSVVAELRSTRPASLPSATPAFPLESVMRIHEELRDGDTAPALSGADALKAGLAAFSRPPLGPAATPPQSTPSTTALAARMESLERAVGSVAAARPSAARPHYSLIGLIAVAGAIVIFGLWMQRRVEARLNDAAVRVSAAERQRDAVTEATNARLTAAREDAARQVVDARQSAVQAQVVGNVLAAPDLVRYWLTGGSTGSRAYAQMLVSRSRGMVFSASRLPPPGAGKTYQLWLQTKAGPVSAGLITPDSAGRVTLATDVPPILPKRLTGAVVTLEPAGGKPRPSGTNVLVRIR